MRRKARQGDRHGVRPAEPRRVDLGPRDGRAARGGSHRACTSIARACATWRTSTSRRRGSTTSSRWRSTRRMSSMAAGAEGADGAEPSGSEVQARSLLRTPRPKQLSRAAAERRKLRPLWDELRRITRAVSVDHDLDVVSDWIRTNRDALVASVGPAEGESLAREVEFATAKIRYVKLLVAGDGAGAIAQGRATLVHSPSRTRGKFVVYSRRRRAPRAASRGRRTRTSPEPRRRRSARIIRRTRVRIPAPARAGGRARRRVGLGPRDARV